jgi:lysophospholipase L1-like esterase
MNQIYLDGLHFNNKGHELMAGVFVENIKKHI